MRKILFLIFTGTVLFFSNVCSFATQVTVDSKIAQVMLYADSVLITRIAEVSLDAGEFNLVFPDIIPEVDEDSLKVTASGEAGFKLFGAQVKKEFLKEAPSARIQEIQAQIRSLNDENRQFEDQKKLLLEEKSFLDSIRLFSGGQIPKDLVTKVPTPQELEGTLGFLDAKLRSNYSAVMDCELKMRSLAEKIDVLERELAQISGPMDKMKRSIIVDAQVNKGGKFSIRVAYLVRGGAQWQPLYDARASFEKNEVELVSYGVVRQSTGEDWNDVEMSLSTAKPSIGGNIPDISPWILRPFQPRVLYRDKMSSMPMAAKAQNRALEMQDEATGSAAPEEEVYATAQEQGIAVIYKLPRNVSVKSDGSEYKLPVSNQILKANFEYSAYPRMSPLAYLGSRVTNSKELQLLAGKVNIFLEGDFVGTSNINNISPGEEFDLYLGADENVKIKREVIEKKSDETLIANIPSPVKQITCKYKLSAENYKSRRIKVKLFDAVPVSAEDRIKVKINQVSLEPKVKDWKDRKGIWLWELELEPKAKQEIFLNFTISHPREMQVEGID
jgi:uncharacterized protein (TIGR02231 family)